ncbi:PIN domain-containing protein [Halosimplex litoreum]|uniref:Ribonuclease VapC n=1 Tax=Halosimplex litoreum TaxID=1198301 RepID=A0A7T3KVR7_9EURY|nr:PIN domain-containing protein [Halosimplex litoreum]QPV63105.1 PIN domain-containing protein [Halosimplex litoreum]
MILDTDFLIELDAGSDRALAHARELEDGGVPLRIPTIVTFEWFISVGKGSAAEANRRAFRRLVSGKPTVELTDSIGRRAGELEGVHQGSDSKVRLGHGDAIVAATAMELDEPVVTTDADFEEIDGLDVSAP